MPALFRHAAYRTIDVNCAITWNDSAACSSISETGTTERENKRRRIQGQADKCLRGEHLFIASARLKGPFGNGWQSPWEANARPCVEKPKQLAGHKAKKPGRIQSRLDLRVTKSFSMDHMKSTSQMNPVLRKEPSILACEAWLAETGVSSKINATHEDDKATFSRERSSPCPRVWKQRKGSALAECAESLPQTPCPSRGSRSSLGAAPAGELITLGSTSGVEPASTKTMALQNCVAPAPGTSTHRFQSLGSTNGAKASQGFRFQRGRRAKGSKKSSQYLDPSVGADRLEEIVTPNGFRYRKLPAQPPKPADSTTVICAESHFGKGPYNDQERETHVEEAAVMGGERVCANIGTSQAALTVQEEDSSLCTERAMAPPPRPVNPEPETLDADQRQNAASTQAAFVRAQESFDNAFDSPAANCSVGGFTSIHRSALIHAASTKGDTIDANNTTKAEGQMSCTIPNDYISTGEDGTTVETPHLQKLAEEITFSTAKKPMASSAPSKSKPRVPFSDLLEGTSEQEHTPTRSEAATQTKSGSSLRREKTPIPYQCTATAPTLHNTPASSTNGERSSSGFQEHQQSVKSSLNKHHEDTFDIDVGLDLADAFLGTADIDRDLRELGLMSKEAGVIET